MKKETHNQLCQPLPGSGLQRWRLPPTKLAELLSAPDALPSEGLADHQHPTKPHPLPAMMMENGGKSMDKAYDPLVADVLLELPET